MMPELTKFMDSLHTKMVQAQSLTGRLETEGGGSDQPGINL